MTAETKSPPEQPSGNTEQLPPAAPSMEAVEKGLYWLSRYVSKHFSPYHIDQMQLWINNARSHIAALTAELEIYRRNDAGGYYSNRKDRETD